MIRKMLVIAAAVAMPAAALAGITAVGGASIASAGGTAPTAGTCNLSGTVTFAKGGLSAFGYTTKKTIGTTATAITPSGQCGVKVMKSKIGTATNPCWTVLPVYNGSKVNPTAGTLASGAAASCLFGATDPSAMTPAQVKSALKAPLYSGTLGGLLSSPASILTALAGGVGAYDNGTKITLKPTGSLAILPGTACGAGEVGFNITGGVTGGGAVTGFAIDICLQGDTGPSTTNHFFADFSAASSNFAINLASGTLDPVKSTLVLS